MRDFKRIENELRFAADAGCDYTLLLEAADALKEAREQIEQKRDGTIYIITAGEYSDYGIIAATLDKDKAKEIKEEYDKEAGDPYGEAEIEEHTDAIFEKRMNHYNVFIKDGNIVKTTEPIPGVQTRTAKAFVEYINAYKEFKDGYETGESITVVSVIAENEDQARKIAKDHYMKAEAEAQGIC